MKLEILNQQVELARQRLEMSRWSARKSLTASQELLAAAQAELAAALDQLELAEEELRQQHEALAGFRQAVAVERQRYRRLLDFIPDGYLITNAEGMIQEANRAAAALLGLSQDLLVGKPLTVFVTAKERRSFRARLTQLLAEPGPATPSQSWEARLQPRDKTPFEVALTVAPMLNTENQMIRFLWLVQDITERKQAEAALAEERTLLRTLIDAMPDTIFVKDVQHRFILGNMGLARSLGVTAPDEFLGKTDFDFHPSDLAAQYWADEETIFQSGQPLINREERVIYPGNEPHWHLTTKVPLRNGDGKIIGLVGMARDVTARKQVEEQLRQSHQFIQKVADISPHLIYIYDLVEQRSVYVNDRVSAMLGYTPAEIQTMESRLLAKLIHPDDHAVTVEHFNQLAADTAGGIFENEYRMKHSNGEWRWLRSRDVVFSRNVAGLPEQILGTVEDITERKRVEVEKERLFQEVSRQREQLRALTRQLAEAQEVERKELARELHDRVGQKLTALGLNLNLIWAQLAETALGAGPIQARLDDSLALVAEMTEHIRDVMANLRPPVLDDYGLVAALHWYGSQLAPRVGFTITVQGEEPMPRLAAPVENVLFRIAQEALTNVAKHARASQVMVTVRADNETVRLVIVDDGIGFEPARQAELIEGQGWGLITMIERAEAVGGHCHIKSRPGQGTQVIVEVAR